LDRRRNQVMIHSQELDQRRFAPGQASKPRRNLGLRHVIGDLARLNAQQPPQIEDAHAAYRQVGSNPENRSQFSFAIALPGFLFASERNPMTT
jgi:hypothetical protein